MVRLHHDHLLVKEPGTTIRTPWHQDQPYYNIDGFDTVSFWIPLDPVPRESTLEFVAGSHASRTWYMPRSFFDDRALVFDEGTFEEVPDIEADRTAHPILGWPLEPGDAVAFNMLTLHAAAGSRNRRRAFSVRLVGDDADLRSPEPDEPDVPRAGGSAGSRRPARASPLPAALAAGRQWSRRVTTLLCYDGSESARRAIERAGVVLMEGPAIVLTVWESLGLRSSGTGHLPAPS